MFILKYKNDFLLIIIILKTVVVLSANYNCDSYLL